MNAQSFIQKLHERNTRCTVAFPNRELAHRFLDDLFDLLFIPRNKQQNSLDDLQAEFGLLKQDFSSLLFDVIITGKDLENITEHFFAQIPRIYAVLLQDAKAILAFDPAAGSEEEVLVAYPGFYATAVYRLSHQLWKQGVKILPRVFTEYAHSKTGIDIHPGAVIGESFSIDHGTGLVIGETAVIGNQVKLYQGVTLGALQVAKELAQSKRHPTIEDNVTVYSGATILGGETVIGHDSIIGGNVWLTYSVEPHSVVYHKSEIKVRDNNPFPEPLNFVI
ncbi:MAG: hypothetical protein RLZZ28_2741 [Bacteroidota bacterium]